MTRQQTIYFTDFHFFLTLFWLIELIAAFDIPRSLLPGISSNEIKSGSYLLSATTAPAI